MGGANVDGRGHSSRRRFAEWCHSSRHVSGRLAAIRSVHPVAQESAPTIVTTAVPVPVFDVQIVQRPSARVIV